MRFKKFALIAVLIVANAGTGASADVDQSAVISELVKEIREMKKILVKQEEKIKALEIKAPQSGESATSGAQEATPPMSDYEYNERLNTALGGANKWLKDLKFSGDLRLRYEGQDFTSGNPAETDPRNRFRFRLRYGFEKTFNEQMKVGFAMASGEQTGGTNVDPTATNVTFDNLFNFKDIFIEKAYATYTPNWAKIGPIEKLEITLGKANNPFELGSSEMVWDRDVKPEGAYEKINIKLINSDNFDLNAYLLGAQYILDEDAVLGSGNLASGDSELFAAQLGVNPVFYTPFLQRPVDILQAVSFYAYPEYAQNFNFTIGGAAGTSLARGNPNVVGNASELDARSFEVVESFTEMAVYPYGLPLRFFCDLAVNANAAASAPSVTGGDFAYAFGTRVGALSKKGDWELRYEYRYLGANALVGAFTDSDFGLGGVGKQGNVFKLAYQLTDNLILASSAYFVDNLNAGTAGIRDEQQRRFQLDLVWKF